MPFNEYGSHGQWVKDNARPKLDAENTIRDDRPCGWPVIGAALLGLIVGTVCVAFIVYIVIRVMFP